MIILIEMSLALLAGLLMSRLAKVLKLPAVTAYLVAGVVLGALGLYQPFADWAGAGATVPLTGFGNNLAKGVKKAVEENGLLGAFTGGFTAAAGGIGAAVFFGYLVSVIFKPGDKS